MAFLSGRRLEKCPKLDDMLHYWPELIEGMRFSTKDFYERIEAALQARSIPELEVARVFIKEGGPLSPRREYLRLRRERLVFDICGMPFGSGFYVSEWFWKQPRRLILLIILVLGAYYGLGYTMRNAVPFEFYDSLSRTLGMPALSLRSLLTTFVPPAAVLVGFLVAALWFGEALDGMLMRIPIVGFFYERYFRPLTYYREDRTQAFQAAAHAALCSVIDDICKTQGIAPLGDAAKRPMHPQLKFSMGPLRRKPGTDGAGPDAGPMQHMQPVG